MSTKTYTTDDLAALAREMAECLEDADTIAAAMEKPWKYWDDFMVDDDGKDIEDGDDGPRYPDIEVTLIGLDGNAGSIMDRVVRALRNNDVSKDEVAAFRNEAYSGDYNNLLATVMKWVSVS